MRVHDGSLSPRPPPINLKDDIGANKLFNMAIYSSRVTYFVLDTLQATRSAAQYTVTQCSEVYSEALESNALSRST